MHAARHAARLIVRFIVAEIFLRKHGGITRAPHSSRARCRIVTALRAGEEIAPRAETSQPAPADVLSKFRQSQRELVHAV
jgi:hypothetical protein